MKPDSNCFDPNSIELCIFCGLYFEFVLSPVFKYKALVCVLYSSIWVLYQGRIFVAPKERKNITDLFCFERAHFKVFVFFMFSFMAYANLSMSQKRLETELTNITRRHFCSLPIFCIEHSFIYSIYFLLSEFFLLFVCFDIVWQLATTHTGDNTHDRDANSSHQNDITWCDYLQGETSRALALLLAFAAGNKENLPLGLHAHEKIWAWLVGKRIFDSKLRSLQRLIKESFAVCNLLFVSAVTL